MTRGDKGRRVFIIRRDFYLHCYTCAHVLVCSSGEKLCNLYCRGEHQHHRYLWELSKGDKILTLCCRKENRWCKHSHTHKFTVFYNARLLPRLCWRGLWLELVILDSPLKSPGKGLQQARSWGGTGNEPRMGLTGSHIRALFTNPDTPELLSSSLSTSMHISRAPTDPKVVLAPAWPSTHKQQPRTRRCFV